MADHVGADHSQENKDRYNEVVESLCRARNNILEMAESTPDQDTAARLESVANKYDQDIDALLALKDKGVPYQE